jgi:hypothetical protein
MLIYCASGAASQRNTGPGKGKGEDNAQDRDGWILYVTEVKGKVSEEVSLS